MPDQSNPASGKPRNLTVKLPYGSVEDFIQRFAASLTSGGAYLRVEEPSPVGSLVQVELQLRSGERVLFFLGVVSFTTGVQGEGVRGMGIKFLQLDEASRSLVARACTGRPGAEAPLPPLPTGVGAACGEFAPQPATIFSFHVSEAAQKAGAAPPAAAPSPAAAKAAGPVHIESPLDKVVPPPSKPTGPIIGIDLGTTNSCVACVKGDKPYVIPSREGHNTIPSIISLSSRKKLLIGHPAKDQILTNPKQTVFGAKRLVGLKFHSPVVQQVIELFNYEIVEGSRGEAAVRLGGAVFSLEQVSAMVLVEARRVASQHLGVDVQRAVVTVPAYYNDHQRQAVRVAGELAGLHVERIVNEPTAAALAYGYGRNLQKTLLVYDLGGGTFDASLLQLNDTVYEVMATGGDTFLGGVDFDSKLVDFLLAEFEVKNGLPFSGDEVARQRVVEAAEAAKLELSEKAGAKVHVPFLMVKDGKPYDLTATVTRAEFDLSIGPLVDRTIAVCAEVIRAAGKQAGDVDEVLLVGGMTRVPIVHKKLEAFLGRAPHKGVHPDEAVGLGAALFGHSLGKDEGIVLIDVLPMSIGIGLPGGRFKKIIERNTALPHSKTYELATTKENQEELELSVFQGDSERVDGAELLGTVKLSPLPKGPRGAVRIDVEFSLSAECLLTITAKEKSKGAEVKATLSTRDTPDAVKAKLAAQVEQQTRRARTGERPARGSRSWLSRLWARIRRGSKAG